MKKTLLLLIILLTASTASALCLGKALSFNGTSSYALASDSPSLQIEKNNAFTVAQWIYIDSYDNNILPRIWEKRSAYLSIMGDSTNGMYRRLGLEIPNAEKTGNNNPAQPGVTEYWGSTRLNIHTWYYVVVTFDNGVVTMTVNDVPETIKVIYPWSGTVESTVGYGFRVGGTRATKSRFFAGTIDQMSVYQRTVTDSEKHDLYTGTQPSGASAVWNLDEGKWSYAKDGSGNANTLNVFNTSWIDGIVPIADKYCQ